MKKIALLFTILCVSQLYGMENYHNGSRLNNGSRLENLSREAKTALDAAFETGNLDTVIKTIKKISDIDNELYNQVLFNIVYTTKYLKEFNQLMHILAQKFQMTPYQIAQKFKTSPARTYTDLYKRLEIIILGKQNVAEANKLIKEGADVNAVPKLLLLAILVENPNPAMIKLLLDNGADPSVTDRDGLTTLDFLNAARRNIPEYQRIKALLEEAMQKTNGKK